ncbi:MAG TPA: GFA family protein [Bradyrhizobium sp.]|nr:GFA family protein [Bradyrhizobium sp.]
MKTARAAAIAAEFASAPRWIWTCCHSAAAPFAQKGILHLPVAPDNFELLRGKNSLTIYTFGTGVAQHTFCSHCGMHAFYVPRSQPDRITVNARCLDDVDGPSLKPGRFFDGRHWEEAQRRRIAEGGHVAAAGLNGAVTLKRILDRASE